MEYFESLGVSKWEILIKIRIPYSLPYVFAALKVAIPLSIIGAVIGEWFGSSKGLGNLIMVSHGNLDTETLFACIFLLAMLGVIATSVVAVVERLFIFWHPSNSISFEIEFELTCRWLQRYSSVSGTQGVPLGVWKDKLG